MNGWASWLSTEEARDPGLLDGPLLLLFAALLSVGVIMMASASVDYAAARYGDPLYHLVRYGVYLLLAAMAALVVYRVPMASWLRHGGLLLFLGMALLVAVLLVGREVNGSTRWLSLGPINLQASEVAKFCVVTYLAGYLVRREVEVREHWLGFIKPMGILGLLVVLLLLEPDFGAVVVLMGASLGMLFLGGVKLVQFLLVLVACLVTGAGMVMTSEYRMQRLLAYLDPWADQYDSGYQLTQSLIAFGRGEWLGVGLGNSIQKQFYLPEAHTDFVFAILGEELGWLGAVAVVLLFAAFLGRMFWIGRRAEVRGRHFAAYLTYGITLILTGQVFINIGVNTGLLPTKGLTLPFLSYGGSSLIVSCMFVAAVLRVEAENRRYPAMAPRRRAAGRVRA